MCLRKYSVKEKWLKNFLVKKTTELDTNEILLLQFSTIENIIEMIDFIDTTTAEEVYFKELSTELNNKDTTIYKKPKVSYNNVNSIILTKIDKKRLDWFSNKQGIIKLNDKEIVILGHIPKELLEYKNQDTCFEIPKKNIFIRYEPISEFYLIRDTVLEFRFRF